MKICYLTWGETPRSYGVFGSQVLGQFIKTKEQMPKDDFYFISGIPIIHSGLIREKFKYRNEIKEIKKRLGSIRFLDVPIFAPQNFVNSSKNTFAYMHRLGHIILKNKFKNINPDIVHCRSYHAAWTALKIKEKYNFNYKIVFDARGLWPEEMALVKKFELSSSDYLFFKNIEKELLAKCDITIAVSDTMQLAYEKIGVNSIKTIYLSVDTARLKMKEYIKENKSQVMFCYVGALTNNTWHRIEDLLDVYSELRKHQANYKLKIITTSSHETIRKMFSKLSEDEIIITSTRNLDELKNELEDVDFGLLPYRKSTSKQEDIVGNSILGTKTVEYIAAGLPLLVNKDCGGAAKIIEKYDLGIVYDPKSFQEINKTNINKYINDGRSSERSKIAEELFDYTNNAVKYKNLYCELYNIK